MKRICAHTTHEGSSNQAMHLAFVEHARCDTAHGRREQSQCVVALQCYNLQLQAWHVAETRHALLLTALLPILAGAAAITEQSQQRQLSN
jgi:hypothetical protein